MGFTSLSFNNFWNYFDYILYISELILVATTIHTSLQHHKHNYCRLVRIFMHNDSCMNKSMTKKPKIKSLAQKMKMTIGSIGFIMLSILHLLFAQGAAGIGIWVQAIPAILAVFAFVLSTYRVIKGFPVAAIIFFGTLPLWLVHIPITILIEDESPIFLIATSISPAIAGIVLLTNYKKTT